jgi:hypothetical protein
MVKLEEIPPGVPGNFDEILNLGPKVPSLQSPGNTSSTPDLPPDMVEVQSKPVEKYLEEMNRMPLFMTSLDETDGEGGENIMLEAMKAMAYDGLPWDVAQNFREQGNDCFRAKKWKDAVEFYTKAIVVCTDERRKRANGVMDTHEEETEAAGEEVVEKLTPEQAEIKLNVVEEAALVNRAACNLELSTFRHLYASIETVVLS